jgi:predicted PurR-regulated permease PerM
MSSTEPRNTQNRKQSLKISRTFYIIFLVGVSLLMFFMARRFIMPVLLAAISAGVFWPVHARLRKISGKSWVSGILSTVIVFLILLIPIGAIGYFAVEQLLDFARTLTINVDTVRAFLDRLSEAISGLPFLRTLKGQGLLSGERLQRILRQIGSWILSEIGAESNTIALVPLQIFIYLYTLNKY